MIFDPLYFVMMAPAVLLALYAQIKVKGTFSKYSTVGSRSGVSGAEAAAIMLRDQGIRNVRIESVNGFLSDHYDPFSRTVRLSPEVFHGRSLSAIGVALHEVGHAIQHAKAYGPMGLRTLAVPMAQFVSPVGFGLLLIGMLMQSTGLAVAGLVLFSSVVLFQLVNLVVEFDASARAKQAMLSLQLVSPGPEAKAVAAVLSAAALTYVAATLQSILQLAYFALQVRGMQSREG
jgi:Zn-dependent membrane protease YugP